jgi:hypothetical protein
MMVLFAGTANATNRSHATLDAITSEIAGHPLNVWCEDNEYDWFVTLRAPINVNGFMYFYTNTSTPYNNVVYLSPRQCERVHLALGSGYPDAGLAPTIGVVFTLVHEAVHHRGIKDEGVTDCTALPFVVPMMEKYFGLTRTITANVQQSYTKIIRRKVKGKWYNFKDRAVRMVTTTIPNPDFAKAEAWALAYHRAKPAAYQGNC